MAKEISREDMRELLGVIKDILGPDAETQKQDMEWKREMESPEVGADAVAGEVKSIDHIATTRGAASARSNSYFREKEPEITSSKTFWSEMVNFLWIVVIVGAIGVGCWSFFSSGTAGKLMSAIKQQGKKAVNSTTDWAQK